MTNATQREESAERLARPLIQLAKASGLSTSFFDQLGTYTEISDEDGHRLEELPQLYDEVCKVRFAHDNTGTNVPHIYAGGI